jgi:hypothetical protein
MALKCHERTLRVRRGSARPKRSDASSSCRREADSPAGVWARSRGEAKDLVEPHGDADVAAQPMRPLISATLGLSFCVQEMQLMGMTNGGFLSFHPLLHPWRHLTDAIRWRSLTLPPQGGNSDA